MHEPVPWYRRPVPSWFPAWLVIGLVGGLGLWGLALAGGRTKPPWQRWEDGLSFVGILTACVVLSAGLLWKTRQGLGEPPAPSCWDVPTWVGAPSFVALLTWVGWGCVLAQRYKGRTTSPGLSGVPAIVLGVALLAFACWVTYRFFRAQPRRPGLKAGALLSVLVLLASAVLVGLSVSWP